MIGLYADSLSPNLRLLNVFSSRHFMVVSVIVVCLLLEPAFSTNFLQKLFQKDEKPIVQETAEQEKGQLFADLDPKTASIAQELTELDEKLTAMRKKEGRLDNYTKLMAKAKQRAEEYEYHDQQLKQQQISPSESQDDQQQESISATIDNNYSEDSPPSGQQQDEQDTQTLEQVNDQQQEQPVKVDDKSKGTSALPKYLGSKFLKKKVQKVFRNTKDSLALLPKKITEASDSIATLLKLDNKARITALIEEVDKAIIFVRAEYSKFVISWSPMMEAALNYLGDKDLHKLQWNEKDEFDLRQDALHMLAIGHEFHLLMLNWRDEQIIAHSAYRVYLESVKKDITEQLDPANKIKVDDLYLFQLEAAHNYILFKCWLTIDEMNLEPRMKLAHLFSQNDRKLKNYESDYFRHIIFFQELFEPTINEFKDEREQVIGSVSTAGDMERDFKEIDEFIEDYRQMMSDEELAKLSVPIEMVKFVANLRLELQYNPLLYDMTFLKDLAEAKRRLIDA